MGPRKLNQPLNGNAARTVAGVPSNAGWARVSSPVQIVQFGVGILLLDGYAAARRSYGSGQVVTAHEGGLRRLIGNRVGAAGAGRVRYPGWDGGYTRLRSVRSTWPGILRAGIWLSSRLSFW